MRIEDHSEREFFPDKLEAKHIPIESLGAIDTGCGDKRHHLMGTQNGLGRHAISVAETGLHHKRFGICSRGSQASGARQGRFAFQHALGRPGKLAIDSFGQSRRGLAQNGQMRFGRFG